MSQILRLALLLALTVTALYGQAAEDSNKSGEPTKNQTEQVAVPGDIDFQIYLLVGSTVPKENAKTPALLEGVIRQLKTTLPFNHYRVGGTMLSRARGLRGQLSLKWNAEASFGGTNKPAFFDITASDIMLNGDNVRVSTFNFGAKVPVAVVNINGQSITQYESVGLSTGFTVRESEPAIIGTLSAGEGGEIGVVVVVARRSGNK